MAPFGPLQPRVKDSSFEKVNMNGVAARRVATGSRTGYVFLYLHGGAYVIGNPSSHRSLASHIANEAEAEVFLADYRLAPEQPYPAGLDDALTAYQWLLDQGYEAKQIYIGGDSAGGGLALCAALTIREQELPRPGGLILISPWTDLTMSSESVRNNAKIDPLLRPSWGKWNRYLYANGRALDDPAISPLFADLSNLPPMLIQVGSDEILLDDSRQLADKARKAGVEVDYQHFEGMWHVFQMHTTLLDESMAAIKHIGAFIRRAQQSG